MIKLTLVTIISIITMSTCQPITNIESTEAGILITQRWNWLLSRFLEVNAMKSRIRGKKWSVSGQYGGRYTNLQEARKAAKFASTTLEYNYIAWVELIADGCNYFTYEHGKCTRDGWTIKH